jgi:hypothetical protein
MTTTQTIHGDSITDTWKLKFFVGRIFTVYPLDGNIVVPVTGADAASSLLGSRPQAGLYTRGSFTIPAGAIPTYSNTLRRATFTPLSWTITCNGSQSDSLQFSQYFILMDEALGTPKVHYVSNQIIPGINLTPGKTHTGATTLETA